MTNKLYYGDNFDVLRAEIGSETVDLVYLDPPFNSNANYNILFKSPAGKAADSQIEAFEDTWHWNDKAEGAFHDVMTSGNTDVAELLRAMRGFLKENDMMAYLAMMAVRLIELHRVLKPTGSLYLHCDPTASHYLKMLLDGVFGGGNFQNEIVWSYRRWPAKAKCFQRMHDTILMYSKRDGSQTFNTLLEAPSVSSMKRWKGKTQKVTFDDTGKRNPTIEVDSDSDGVAMNAVWPISIIAPVAKERLGYPTQKPLALLERIIAASSNPGDVVLDPFCGCGTAVDAAQKLGRQWIGIDVTHLSIGLIERRMKDRYGEDLKYDVIGTPNDLASAEKLAADEPHQFQYWITQAIEGQPFQGGRKGMDRGIDGYLYFTGHDRKTEAAIISVKAGRNVGVAMVRDLKGVVEREKAPIGIFICVINPTREMEREAAAAGVYEGADGRTYPRLQLYTIAEYFQGHRPKVPLLDRQAAYRKAAREPGGGGQAALDL